MPSRAAVTFCPSRVDGAGKVVSVTVTPRALELVMDDGVRVVRFADIARYPRPTFVWRALARVGIHRRWLAVADRDWFHAPPDRFFRFYTTPRLTILMPTDEPEDHDCGHFARIDNVIHAERRFTTLDLG